MRPILFLVFVLIGRLALAGLPTLEPILVNGGSTSIGSNVLIAKDERNEWDATQALQHGRFLPSNDDVPNLGLGHSCFWILFELRNETVEQGPIIHVGNPEIDELDLFRVVGERPYPMARAGLARPNSERRDGMHDLAFDLGLNDGEHGVFLIRVKSLKQLRVPIEVRSAKTHTIQHAQRNLLLGAYIGIMMVLLVYNLFVYFSIKDTSYLTYVLYILFVSLTQLTFLGVSRAFLWPDSAWFSLNASLILTLATAVTASEFMRSFIRTKERIPRYDALAKWFYGAFAICVALYTSGATLAGYLLAQVGAGLFATYLLLGAIQVVREGSREAGFFLLAWSAFLIGTVVFLLKDIGILPYNGWTLYTMPVGAAIEGILLSFGLADRINVLRREKEASQAQALAASLENERIIREQNVILESKVHERTKALQESNEDLKRTQTQLVNAEKMASLGQLTAGIAHEINNPINFITSNVAPLRRNIADLVELVTAYRQVRPERAAEELERLRNEAVRLGLDETITELDEIIASISEGSHRTAEIVRGLRNFSRLDEDDLKDADLNEGIRSTLTVLGPQYRDKVRFDLSLGELPKVECFPGKVNQVFMNILTNAVQATLARTDLADRLVRVATTSDGDQVTITISDNGVGMSAEVRARIFDPFFTTKPVGEGTGLGMAIVYGIVEDHQGRIEVDSMPGAGTEFRIVLPLRQQRQVRARA